MTSFASPYAAMVAGSSIGADAERCDQLTRQVAATLAELVTLARQIGYPLEPAVEHLAATLPRPGEPWPELSDSYCAWLDELEARDPDRATQLLGYLLDRRMTATVVVDPDGGPAAVEPAHWRPGQ